MENLQKQLIEIEKELDAQMEKLSIWELPFQAIISTLLLTIDNIDLNGRTDTAMDYASRLSYVFPIIKAKAKPHPVMQTTEAILMTGNHEYMADINFINAYAHFCLLMPQVRKGMLTVSEINGHDIFLQYPSDEVIHAESIDKLYSYLSIPMITPYLQKDALDSWVAEKVKRGDKDINDIDFRFIKNIHEHYNKYFIMVKQLPDEVFTKVSGVTYDEYHSFCATIRAFSDFFISLSRAYYNAVDRSRNNEIDDQLMSEYFEWIVCCLNYKTLSWFSVISGLDLKKLDSILSFYLQIYTDTTGENFQEKSICGEGNFPPFLLMEDTVIYSPQACKYMLSINNILYSINKKERKIFDEEISKHLEPALICQLEYIFSFLPTVVTTKNIVFKGSELDFIVLSENENVAICIQVKSTVAPDSARTVERVSDRALEGIEQIKLFDSLSNDEKQHIINDAFNKNLANTKIINLLVVRSSAGSVNAWKHNHQYKIINYCLLAWVIACKIEAKNLTITDFEDEVANAQNELLKAGKIEQVHETLTIGKYRIRFPNLSSDIQPLFSMNIKSFEHLRDFENLNC